MQKTLTIEASKIVSALVILISLLTFFLIPNTIMKYGYMPDDDAMRHVAKVISHKDWNQILVLRSDIKLDPSLGWHKFLGFIYNFTDVDAKGLLCFCVISLFFLFCVTPIPVIRRPEAWLLALIVMGIMPTTEFYLFDRILRGRPYIVTMAVILAMGFLWPKLNDKKSYLKTAGIMVALIAVSTYLHSSWYLFAIPIACFFIARQWRAGIALSVSAIIGISIGAIFTCHPFIFLTQTLRHLFLALGTHKTQAELVTEFRAGAASTLAIGAIFLMLIWRRTRGSQNLKISRDPIFMMTVLCMALGCLTRRIWFDLGRPAFCVWMTLEFQEYLESIMERDSLKRILLVVVLAVTLMTLVATDPENRWSANHPLMALSPEKTELALWIPEDGGIVYSDSMEIFYQTFYKFPKAKWRYIFGFEAGLMPPEDLAILRNIQSSNRAVASFEPWVRKMRPADRLILPDTSNNVQFIHNLEWLNTLRGVWIGRLPRKK